MSFQKKETEKNWVSEQTCCLGFLMLAQRAHSPSSWKKAGTAAAVEKMHSGFGVLVTTFFWQIQLPADNSNLFDHSCFAYDGIWGSLVEEATAFPFDVTCRLWMVAEPSPNKSPAPPFVLIWKKKRSIIFHDSQIYSSLPSLVRKGFGIILHSMWLAKPNIC